MEKLWLLILVGLAIVILVAGALYLLWRAPVVVGAVAYSSLKQVFEKMWPRLFAWILFSTLLFAGLFFMHPQQVAVAYYKFALVLGGAVVGYWLDRSTFPYARPDGFLKDFWQKGTTEPLNQADFEVVEEYKTVYALVMLRRAIIMASVILGVTLGL